VPTTATLSTFPKDAVLLRKGKKIAAKKGTVLLPGDVLKGSRTASIDVQLATQATLRLKPKGTLNLKTLLRQSRNDPETQDTRLKLDLGTLLVKLRALRGQSRFLIDTPSATAAARGTSYLVEVGKAQTSVVVGEGVVGVVVPADPGVELKVEAQQQATVRDVLPPATEPVRPVYQRQLQELQRLPLPPSGLRAGQQRTNPVDGLVMLYVPPGEFMMGATDLDDSAKPVHKVRLTRGFWMYRTPITNGQYALFCAATKHPKNPYVPGWTGKYDDPDQPATDVTWNDAQDYCRWAVCRLPTEAEWEFAARGGDGRKYPWGNDPPAAPRVAVMPPKHPAVGIFPAGASPFGLLDMAGSASNWCEDRFGPYAAGDQVDPTGPAQGTVRVFRGGGRTESRGLRSQSSGGVDVGIRPVRTE
jgi:formylglycine-generating enzyme required for sulfatase activity